MIFTELPAKILSFVFKAKSLAEVKLTSPFVETKFIAPEMLFEFNFPAIIEPESLKTLKSLPVLTNPLKVISDAKAGFIIA